MLAAATSLIEPARVADVSVIRMLHSNLKGRANTDRISQYRSFEKTVTARTCSGP
jgi:hypothetical protein